MKKTPLTAEELRELEFLYTLPYDELLDYSKRQSLLESKETVIKEIDMTYKEFVFTPFENVLDREIIRSFD